MRDDLITNLGPNPTHPKTAGTYKAREITYYFGGTRSLGPLETVEVVADVPNPRGDRLLVKTALKQPKHKGLNCYEWVD